MKLLYILLLLLTFNVVEAKPKSKTKSKKATDTQCLARVIYHEARGESLKGQKLVAIATLNRTKHPEYPKSICKVVYQKGQYEWTTKKDHYKYDKKSFDLAKSVIKNYKRKQNKNITFFSTKGFKNKRLAYVTKVGGHKFYRIKGS